MNTSPPAPLRIGIAGLGRMGRRHAENLAFRVRGCRLVAACSPVADEREHARRELGVSRVHERFEDLLADPEVEALVLVTPTSLHAEQTIHSLESGRHVFVEKPLALDVESCLRAEEVAARLPRQRAMVGFVRRFDASYAQVRHDIDAGMIGRPFLVRSQTCDMNDPSGFFVRFSPTSGGIFADMSVHDIDIARWYLGGAKARRAWATGTVAIHQGLREHGDLDNGIAVVDFDDGRMATIYASRTFAHGHETTTEVIGTGGSLLIGQGAERDRVAIRDAHGVRRIATADFYARFRDAFVAELDAFVAACRGDGELPLTLSDATEATRIALAITRAVRTGEPQPL